MLDDTTMSTRHTSAEAFGKVGIKRRQTHSRRAGSHLPGGPCLVACQT